MKRIFSKVIKIYINCFYKGQKLSRGVLGSSCSRNDRKVRLHVTILFTNLFEALQKTASKSTVFKRLQCVRNITAIFQYAKHEQIDKG